MCLRTPVLVMPIGVGAQSILGRHQIFAQKYVLKISKMPKFYKILARKIIKIPEFYDICPKNLQNFRISHDFCPKNARILHNNCPKNIFSRILGGGAVSYAYGYVTDHSDDTVQPITNISRNTS